MGGRYECPCCGWRVRGFMDRSGWSLQNTDGYCPRCNAKARHRRLWLYLRNYTNFFGNAHRVLDVGPSPGLSRALAERDDLYYVSVGIDTGTPHLSVVGDIRALPFAERSFDVVLCQHVLEHVDDDRRSLAEIRRVTKNCGWVVLSVPMRLDQTTHEDPTVTKPEERERLFGEAGHVRMYGYDLVDRLEEAGFESSLQNAEDIPSAECERNGLRKDEHLFICCPREV
jgi:SAM-dependent methyltransferase